MRKSKWLVINLEEYVQTLCRWLVAWRISTPPTNSALKASVACWHP